MSLHNLISSCLQKLGGIWFLFAFIFSSTLLAQAFHHFVLLQTCHHLSTSIHHCPHTTNFTPRYTLLVVRNININIRFFLLMVCEAQPISILDGNFQVEMLFPPFGVLFDNYRHSHGMLSIGCHLDQADFYQKGVAQNCRQSEYEQFDSNCSLAAFNLLNLAIICSPKFRWYKSMCHWTTYTYALGHLDIWYKTCRRWSLSIGANVTGKTQIVSNKINKAATLYSYPEIVDLCFLFHFGHGALIH